MLACAPIWSVSYFFSADGPAHLHSASLIIPLLSGQASETYSLNSVVVPNSLGHWLMAVLLSFLHPYTVSKIIATLTYCGFVASASWLRYSVYGLNGLGLGIIGSAVLSFDRIWLVGLYNFVIGTSVFLVILGFVFRWEGKVTGKRAVLLAILFVFAFFSHMVAFSVAVVSVVAFVGVKGGVDRMRTLVWTFAALLPILPFAVRYELLSLREGSVAPVWYLLSSPMSVDSVVLYLRGTDPFFIISRRFIPFLTEMSGFNVLAAPFIWIVTAAVLLLVGSCLFARVKERLPHFAILGMLFVIALLAPDEIGSADGSVIRPRLMLMTAAVFTALITVTSKRLSIIGAGILVAVFAYQNAALWEYATRYSRQEEQFHSAAVAIASDDKVASVTIIDETPRFFPHPLQRMSCLYGIGTNVTAWDNYEMGSYYFPVTAARREDRTIFHDHSESALLRLGSEDENHVLAIERLRGQLAMDHDKITALVVWGRNDEVDQMIGTWFDPHPAFEKENIRVFRTRKSSGA